MYQGRGIGKEEKMSNKKNRTNKKTKFDAILQLLSFVYVVISIMFYIALIKMDMLPGIYVTIFTIAEMVFTFAIATGLAKKHKTRKLNIVCLIIAIVVSIMYVNAINYLFATDNFLKSMFKEVVEQEEYYVVVKKDSKYDKIEDLNDERVYIFQVEDDVKTEIQNKASIVLKQENNLADIGNKLVNSDIEAILISSTQYSMLDDEIKDFKANTKVIYTATHKIEKKAEISNKNSKNNIENGIFNVYISGIDTYGNINNVSRSDANILATVNTKTHEVLLTSIPRDYYVTLHSKKAKDKLTHSGIYGVSETVTTVEDLLNVDINYYVRVNFTTVIKLVDTIGGVDVYSNYNFTTNTEPSYTFSKGYNHLNGGKALAYSRERYSFSDGDNQRVKNQQQVIEAIINKVLDSTTILTKYTSILNSLEGSFQTNIEQSEISKLVKNQLENMSSWTVKSNSLTGTGSYGPTYSMGSQELYIMLPDSTSVQNAKSQIKAVMGK